MHVQIETKFRPQSFPGFFPLLAHSAACSLCGAPICALVVYIFLKIQYEFRKKCIAVTWKFDSAHVVIFSRFFIDVELILLHEIHLEFQYIEFAFLCFDFGFLIEKGLSEEHSTIQCIYI